MRSIQSDCAPTLHGPVCPIRTPPPQKKKCMHLMDKYNGFDRQEGTTQINLCPSTHAQEYMDRVENTHRPRATASCISLPVSKRIVATVQESLVLILFGVTRRKRERQIDRQYGVVRVWQRE